MQSLSLADSQWRFRDCTSKNWMAATIPGCVHTDLRRAKKIPDPFWATNEKDLQWIEERDWEYRTPFRVSEALHAEEHIELVADGLDTVATVILNGYEIARTENMFIGWRWDVKRHLRTGKGKAGENELVIRFDSAMRYIRENRTEHTPAEINDPVGGCTRIRKQQCQFGWDWGPRFVTVGIWRDIRLEGWSRNRIEGIRVTQKFSANYDRATLTLTPELARADANATCMWKLTLAGKTVSEGTGNEITITNPQLWWPNGQGEQPLYTLEVEIFGGTGSVRSAKEKTDDTEVVPPVANKGTTSIGTWTRRIGLRTLALDRTDDQWGHAFRFVVNGRAIFAKGANWIPAHSFVTTLIRKDYARDLRAAQMAHMNMVRVWGGGIYESEDFYDECDERGLLVWQDFMFGCTPYPGDDAFVASFRDEAACQIRRLRHRACLALWCGNNEVWSINEKQLVTPEFAAYRAAYERVFHETLPSIVTEHDGITDYWPSSPWRGDTAADHATGEKRGDTHYWDVWHARHPVRDYEKWAFRFVSEFGMQSYSSPETNATFCPPHDDNVFGPLMENHQKNRAGNQVILDYVSRRYRFPHGQDALIYLSQLNQAYCMQAGVEHYRRLMPRCMGALYWQINDCWPVASWSSIEFTGRWKALHHVARRFYAPMIASAQIPGEETATIGNYRASTVSEVNLYTVSDNPVQTRAALSWELRHIDGRKLLAGRKAVELRHGESVKQHTLDLTSLIAKHGRDHIYLRIALDALTGKNTKGTRVYEDTVFLAPPRFLSLPKETGKTKITAKLLAPTTAEVTFTSSVFQHRFAYDIPGTTHETSDNYFDLYPGEKKTVRVDFAKPLTAAKLAQHAKRIAHRSLADTYE